MSRLGLRERGLDLLADLAVGQARERRVQAFADWDITGPKGYGILGSLADHGVAEFLLVLHRG